MAHDRAGQGSPSHQDMRWIHAANLVMALALMPILVFASGPQRVVLAIGEVLVWSSFALGSLISLFERDRDPSHWSIVDTLPPLVTSVGSRLEESTRVLVVIATLVGLALVAVASPLWLQVPLGIIVVGSTALVLFVWARRLRLRLSSTS